MAHKRSSICRSGFPCGECLHPCAEWKRKVIENLKKRALAIGGKRFQKDEDIELDLEGELDRIDWREFDGRGARLMKSSKGLPMEPCRCHNNSAMVALQRKWECWTGLALSDDGIWRVHSWVRIPSTGSICETTEPRLKYYGVKVDPHSCLDFPPGEIETGP